MTASSGWREHQLSRRGALAWLAGGVAMLLPPVPAGAVTVRRVRRICRRSWGARPRTGPYRRHKVVRITVHHSGMKFRDNRRALARFRAHQTAHQAQGWPDIAYHLLIDRHGHLYRGRPLWAKGDTATNYNPRGHLLVMCEGNFQVQAPTRAQVRTLVNVLAWATVKFDVPLRRITGHRDHASTACPGDRLYSLLRDRSLHRRVRRRVDAGGVSLHTICGDAGDDLVARIKRAAA